MGIPLVNVREELFMALMSNPEGLACRRLAVLVGAETFLSPKRQDRDCVYQISAVCRQIRECYEEGSIYFNLDGRLALSPFEIVDAIRKASLCNSPEEMISEVFPVIPDCDPTEKNRVIRATIENMQNRGLMSSSRQTTP